MIIENLIGTAANFIPRNVAVKKTIANIELLTNFSTIGNKIALFNGPMPDVSALYDLQLFDSVVTTNSTNHVATISNLGFTYIYDFERKERTVKVTSPDALDFIANNTGTIGWFAVKLVEATGEAVVGEEILVFSDSVGTWADTNRAVIVDSVDSVATQGNIFKSFLLSIKDSITSELV